MSDTHTPAAEAPPAPTTSNGRVKASPLARRLARERGIDISTLQGTGPDGRIVAKDVEGAQARPAAPAAVPTGDVESIPRRTVPGRRSRAPRRAGVGLPVDGDR